MMAEENKDLAKEENILVFCSHSDDQIIGPGGTLAKYAKDGKKVYSYIFSYGELTHPHFKRKVIVKIRVEESKKADTDINGAGVAFFGLPEGKFLEEARKHRLKKKIKSIIASFWLLKFLSALIFVLKVLETSTISCGFFL